MGSYAHQLGEYLRARRAVTQPEAVGLVRGEGRRVPGLRRNEVAALAGISAEYYLRLEQGRGTRPSDQVLRAIARAFRLDAEAEAYLFRLATATEPDQSPPARHVAGQIAGVLGRWTSTPAYLSDRHRDIVAANPLATTFGGGGLGEGHNQIASLFSAHNKASLVEWEAMAASALATLRRDAHPRSSRLAELVRTMSADADFVRLWARHDVSAPEDARFHITVEGVGTLEIEGQNFGVRSLPGYQVTVLAAPVRSRTESVFAQLAASIGSAAAAPHEGSTTRASHLTGVLS